MTFQIPEGLAPEAYPLAWLLGTWRGPGFLAYPSIPQRGVLTEAEFTHDGGPYLAYSSTTWLLQTPLDSLEGEIDVDALQPGQVWSTESGFWRIAPQDPAGAADGTGTAGPAPGADAAGTEAAGTESTGSFGPAGTDAAAPQEAEGATPARHQPKSTALEVLLSEPSGHVSVFLGAVEGPRVELSTDLVARTATGAEISAASRMYGLVGGELLWATDLAAFGHELQSYSSGRMQRQE
ncbi:MAG TPA: FABP family protein [Beutenbergiaceae bacterium]|nr:FABP family protein [Beutenbergiaceae bacterium]